MSQTTDEYRDLSDDELLERIAAKDPETVPLAERARAVLAQEDSS